MTSLNRPVRKLSRSKRMAFAGAALVLAWMITELVCRLILTYVEYTYKFSAHKSQTVVEETGESGKSAVEAIHPYLGWVLNPQVNSAGSTLFSRTIPVNSLGFNDEEHGIPKRRPDRVIVAVTGGSVAWQVSVAGEKLLREELEKTPQFRGKQLQLVRLAMSGYKQPQQLMALNYMLALGAEFDVVVNIDGYNEVALTVAENDEMGVFAAYPRMWHARMHDVVDPRKYTVSFQILKVRALRQQLAADRLQSWLSWSPTLNLIWYVRDKRLETQMVELAGELRQQIISGGLGFTAKGPAQIYRGSDGLHRHVLELWSNSSLQMQRLCAGNGIAYVHILQPNQYLTDSKPMTAEEREKCISGFQDYGKVIQKIYPLVIQHAEVLRQAGVDFHDLTRLFAEVEEPIYADPFCHYNQRGNDLLAQSVAEFIQRALDKPSK